MKKHRRLIAFLICVVLVFSETSGISFPVRAESDEQHASATDATTTDSEEKGLSAEVEGISVSVKDVNDVLPEGAYIQVEKLEDKKALEMAQDVAGQTEDGTELVRDAVGVDITFFDAYGKQFEPSDDVEVSIDLEDYRSLDIEDKFSNPSYDVLHIPEKGEPEFIENKDSDEDGVVFESDEFSPYIITASPINLYRANQPTILSGYSDYSPYLTTHILTVDNKEILSGDTIEPTQSFELELSFNMKLSDMSQNMTATTDGLKYYFALPDHISIGDKGTADSQIPLYNSRNVQIGTYYIKSSADGDVMYVTFPGFYDDVTTNFDLSASWSDTDDQDSIDVPWKDRTDTYKINRTSLIITKDQTHAKRGEDGILRNTFTVTIKAKDNLMPVSNVNFKDEMTSQHMILDPESIDDGAGNKYAFKITAYAADGTVTGEPTYLDASAAVVTDAGAEGKKTTLNVTGLTVPQGGKLVVEYTAYIPREVKRTIDENSETDTLTNTAAASHPVTNSTTNEVENPWITSKVTDNIIPKKEWIMKDANNKDLVKVTDTDNTEYIVMDYDVEINPLREYTMGGALVRDVISNSFYSEDDIKYTNVTYDVNNLSTKGVKVTKTVKANTTTEKELNWVVLDTATYNNFLTKINVKDPLNALSRLKNNADLADVRNGLQSAIAAAGYSFTGDYTDYIYTDAACHEFIWLLPEDDVINGDTVVGTYKLHYYTVSGLGVGSFSNSASLRYREMDPVVFGAIGYPGDYGLTERKIDATKHNEGVYLGNDGNYYIDWTITVGVPANSRGWEDVMLIDEFPRYEVGTGDDKIVYSDWLKGLNAPDYDSLNSGVFKFSTESSRPEVQAIVKRAKVGLDNGYWNAYSETMTSTYANGYFVERPDEEWIDYLSQWGSTAFNASIVSRGTYYKSKDLAAGQFIVDTDGTDWVAKVKKGDTGTLNNYTIYLGDFPASTTNEGYEVKIKYTTQVNPLLVKRLPDILKDENKDVVTLTNVAHVYHSYVKRDGEGNILGRALMQGGTNEGWIGDLNASYWLGSGDAQDCIVKDKTGDYDKSTGTVSYKSYLNKNKDLSANTNVYTIQDAMNVPGVLYKDINLKFPSDVNGGAAIITNGVVADAYKNYVTVKATTNADNSNTLTITFDNKDSMFQDANGKVAQLELTYKADFKTNDVPTDVTLNNSVVLSEKIPSADGKSYTTKLIDQAEVEYTVDKALDKNLDTTSLPAEANNFTAKYYILVDPTSENANELKTLPVGDVFTVRDTMGSSLDLILSSVKVSKIENGTATDITTDCQRSYNAQTKVLDVKIAKQSNTAEYKIEYSVNVTHLSKDGETYLGNKAEILGTTVKKDELNERVSIMNSSESSDATTNMIRVQKYDMNDISATVNATFDIYKYDNGWKCLTSGADRIFPDDYQISTTGGKVVITNKMYNNQPVSIIEKDTWYKLVEVSTDPGYTVNNEPLYYYVSVDGQTHSNPPAGVTNYTIATLLTGKTENEVEEDTLPTLLLGNKKAGFDIEKTDKATGDVIPGIEFTIYSDEQCTNALDTAVTDSAGIAEFAGITALNGSGDGDIYLKETGTTSQYLANNNIYKITFAGGNVTAAVNVKDANDTLKIDSTGILSKVNVENISKNNKLIVEKKVQSISSAYKNDEFEFIINLTDDAGNTLTGSYNSRKYYADGTADLRTTPIKSGDRISLKSDERVEIEGLPTGAGYKVSELTPRDYDASLTVTDKVGTDSKVSSANFTTGTIEEGSADHITFNNRRKTSIIVTKEAVKEDGTALNIPDGFTVTIRSENNQNGPIWAIAKYDKASGKFVSDYLADASMVFTTSLEDGTPIDGGFRITGINTSKGLAVIESNADIAGYAYKLSNADSYNTNCNWSGESSDDRTVALKNTYYESYAEVNLTANKTLVGRKMDAGEFSFALYTTRDNGEYKNEIKTGVKNDATGKIDFGRITYTLADLGGQDTTDKYYMITEIAGTNTAIKYDSTTKVYVKVHLHKEQVNGVDTVVADEPVYSSTDMKDGSAGDGNKPSFVNTYNAWGNLDLKIGKTIKGKDASDGEFTFTLTEYTDDTFTTTRSDKPVPLSQKTSSAISKDGTGEITFGTLTFPILVEDDGRVVLNEGGTHYYIIEEVIPAGATKMTMSDGTTAWVKDGIGYDDTKYKIAIVANDDKQGNITPTVYKINDDGTTQLVTSNNFTKELAFTNSYEAAGDITFSGTKTVSAFDKMFNKPSLKAGMFNFTVTDTNNKVVATGSNDSDGKIVYTSITYGISDVGTHEYIITEDSDDPIAGMLYDTDPVKATVEVIDNGDGTISADVSYEKKGQTVAGADFINDASEIKVKKTDKQGKGLAGAEFDITTKDGKVVTSFTSNGEINHIYGLAVETDYVLVETKAPEGYKTADDVSFKLDKTGTLFVDGAQVNQIIVEDEKMETSVPGKQPSTEVEKPTEEKKDGTDVKQPSTEVEKTTEEKKDGTDVKQPTAPEQPSTQETPETPNKPGTPSGPSTGDNLPLVCIIVIMLASLAGIVFIFAKKRKNK